MKDFKDFFERATALRDTIEQSDDVLKDVRLDILSQLVGQVFRYRKVPYSFTIQSDCLDSVQIAFELLYDLEINGREIYFIM